MEAPVRVESILREILPTGLFDRIPPRRYSERHILAVHDAEFVEYLKRMSRTIKPGETVYPYVFPIRNRSRPPVELAVRAGYYCIDTFTPLTSNVFIAAKRAVDCAITAAVKVRDGARLAYVLVRPPGHHAEPRNFGGFCYFNSTAAAAHFLSAHGTVAILDIDYHHGNGQQEIFYARNDVFTVSIHGNPRFAYPYFSGFASEVGVEPGLGFNFNDPLPEEVDGKRYREALQEQARRVARFRPQYLVVALGLDTAKADPTGTWSLGREDFRANGEIIGRLGLPTLVMQEGGYNNRVLGQNARAFFEGLYAGAAAPSLPRAPTARATPRPRA